MRDLGERETARRAADLAASYEHAIVEALMARVERALDAEPRLAIGGGVAANRLLRERAAGPRRARPHPAAGALHRQRGDDRVGRALRRSGHVPGLPRARRLRHRPPSRSIAVPGCHLCDDARAALERVRARATFSLHEVDITTDDELHRRYLERIPVVALGDEELFDFFVDEAALEARLYRLPR